MYFTDRGIEELAERRGDEHVTLPKDEAEHLTRVLRISVGDTVAVFDGRGLEFLARVTAG